MNQPIIIFDFNRTLYDPDSARLVPGTLKVLGELQGRGCVLYLISRGGPDRARLIRKLGLESVFAGIKVTERKNLRDFRAIAKRHPTASIYVVGDRPSQEIRLGNRLGFRTIRFLRGKFSREIPRSDDERADLTIDLLTELTDIVR
ncbi:MAG: HAD hydrolase-like protein [Patescibacteria group bacterium]|nr:HAD hydrolase-like protein [Patescibacteria group bacterium]